MASEWSAIRTRLRDPVTPGRGEESETAREGWENGEGVLHRSGQVYVHTFETTGTHEYPCVPREAAGTVGSVTVE